jgi:uncharacterized protein with von Willebrand factor type A (vWA) domain
MPNGGDYSREFRPDDHWASTSAEQAIRRGVRGDLRRDMIQTLSAAGELIAPSCFSPLPSCSW